VEGFDGDFMKFQFDCGNQRMIILDNRERRVWEATEEICASYSLTGYSGLRKDPPTLPATDIKHDGSSNGNGNGHDNSHHGDQVSQIAPK